MTPLPREFLKGPFAHRGLHGAGRVENSRAAVQAAVAAGLGVEIDVQLSADGEAMVFHDATLDRLTVEHGPISGRSSSDLGRIALRGGGGTIPTLREILSLVAGRAPLLVEIKDQGGALSQAGVGPLEARAAALLDAYEGPVAAMSFNPSSVAFLRDAAPKLPRGLVACAPEGYADQGAAPEHAERLAALVAFEAVEAAFLSYDADALPSARVAGLRAAGATALCWTIRSEASARRVRDHVDAITFEGFSPPPRAPKGC
jgi:glycerophosphoryl diester phosphodiesterase